MGYIIQTNRHIGQLIKWFTPTKNEVRKWQTKNEVRKWQTKTYAGGVLNHSEVLEGLPVDETGIYNEVTDRFFNVNLPSRLGSIGRLVGLKGHQGYYSSSGRYTENYPLASWLNNTLYDGFSVILRFDDEEKDVTFSVHQISEAPNATATNYIFIKQAKPKREFSDKYNQPLEVDDMVICVTKGTKQIDFAKVVRFNTASISVKSIFNKNDRNNSYFVKPDQLVKIEPELEMSTQITLISLSM